MGAEKQEIAKLRERIAKDPKSKLFVSLAEELRKGGDRDAAIRVLQEGLKHSPTYITARSFLGRYLLEKGDLASALKEFQAVAAAIPDNLLAQRKLGDILVLMDREPEALEKYRIVSTLTPRDVEVSGLITEIEAGRSVKSRIAQMQQVRPASAPAPKTDTPAKAPEKAHAVPAPAAPTPASAEKGASVREEAPEDILAFEALAPEPLSPEPAGTEHAPDLGAAVSESAIGDFPDIGSGGSADNGPEILPDLQIPDLDTVVEQEQEIAVFSEQGGAGESASPRAQLKKADDFTTDTLAELYIAQGFYEKAIDIYDRMLADNPGNQGLIDKLARLRSLAGGESAATEEQTVLSDPLLAAQSEQDEYQPGQDEAAAIFGGEDVPGTPDEQGGAASFDAVFEPAAETAPRGSFFEDEPKEYVPPEPSFEDSELLAEPAAGFDLTERPADEAVPEAPDTFTQAAPLPQPDSAREDRSLKDVGAFPRQFRAGMAGRAGQKGTARGAGAGREAVIGRLEQWLKNIAKET